MKKGLCVVLVSGMLSLSALSAWAGSGAMLFETKCGSCHYDGGPTQPVDPRAKAGKVWEKYFSHQRHTGSLEQSLPNGELSQIVAYLSNNGADSPQPMMGYIP